ncbi:MAG: PTS system mannose/fructose/sorbose family transporter subunit IID [bacterium]|nr:PTS system mannose/fructose/sorbose family transporter subunit IID [bacterium]
MSRPGSPAAGAAIPHLPGRLRLRVFLRLLVLQASWNHQRMQNLGLLVSLMPWLSDRPRDAERDRLFCRRYYEFFNTNPYLAGYVVGGLLRLEQEREGQGGLPRGQAQVFRDSLARALASLGDQLFWLGLRPATLLLAAVLALLAGSAAPWPLAVLAVVVVGFQFAWRWRSLGRGYVAGYDIVELLGDRRWHRAITLGKRATLFLGAALAGLLLREAATGSVRTGAPAAVAVAALAACMAVPVAARRRWAGEFIVLTAAAAAVVLAFALGTEGS